MDYEAMATSAGVGSVSTGGIGLVRNAETPWKVTMPGENVGSGGSGSGGSGGSGGGGGSGSGSGDGSASGEEGGGGSMHYTGSGGSNLKEKLQSAIVKGKIKKYGPVAGILVLVIVGVVIFSMSNVAAPFAFLSNVMEQYNNIQSSMSTRSTYFTRFQMDSGRNKSITKRGAIFGNEKFSIGKKTQSKLKANNIDYIETEGTDGKKLKLLVYNDAKTNERVPIVVNESDVGRIPSGNTDIDVEGKTTRTAITLDAAMKKTDFNFKQDLDVSTRTLKGHIAGWYDSVAEKLHKRISNSRRKFNDLDETAEKEEIIEAAKSEGLETDAGSSKSDGDEGVDEDGDGQTDVDEDGNEKTKSMDSDDSLNKNTSRAELETKLTSRAKKLAGTGTLACQVLKGISAVNAVIRAINIANTLNYVTGFLEAINRTQVGDGSAAMDYYMENLTTPGDTVVAKYNEETKTYSDEAIREDTTAWGSAAMGQIFQGSKLTQDDELVQRHNLDYSMKYAMESKGLWAFSDIASSLASLGGNNKTAYLTCLAAQAISGVADSISDIVELVLDVPTLGLASVIKWVGEQALSVAASAAISFAIGQIISFVLPTVAQWLAVDFISSMVGEEPAYAIVSGVSMYMGKNTQSGTGTWLTKDGLVAQHRENQKVIAEEAEFERRTLSPFDITSPNTFLGSITHSLASVSYKMTSSPLGTVSSIVKGFGSSLRALMPGVSAASDETELLVSVNEECDSLSSLTNSSGQAVGDAFCNPYFGQNFSTVDDDPADVFERIDAGGNFTGQKDNPDIKGGSDLSKYIVACEVRETQMGYYDSSIGQFTTGNDTADAVLDSGVGSIPILGGIADVIDAGNGAANAKWANGEACGDPQYADFAQYSVDQKIMEEEGLIDKSAVTSFLEDYYEKNPLDDSYEGVIARYSGLTKEQTEETLALLEYAQYVANYKPDQAVAMGEKVEHQPIMFESSQVVAKTVPEAEVVRRVAYRDLRSVGITA